MKGFNSLHVRLAKCSEKLYHVIAGLDKKRGGLPQFSLFLGLSRSKTIPTFNDFRTRPRFPTNARLRENQGRHRRPCLRLEDRRLPDLRPQDVW